MSLNRQLIKYLMSLNRQLIKYDVVISLTEDRTFRNISGMQVRTGAFQ